MMKPHEAFLYSILLISYALILWTSYQVYCHTYQKILNPLSNEQKLASFYRYNPKQNDQAGNVDENNKSCWFAIKFDEDIFHFVNHIDHYDSLKAWLFNQSCIDQILEGQMISVQSVNRNQQQAGIHCQASIYQMTTKDKLAFAITDYPKPKLCFQRNR